MTISPVGTSIFILAPYAKDVNPRIFLLPRTLYVHTLDKSHIPTRVRDAVQETGGLSQNRTVTIAYRESSPRQTQRRLCGVTIQTSCFDSGTSPTRSVGLSVVYIPTHPTDGRMSIHALFAFAFDLYWSRESFDFRAQKAHAECPSMCFSLARSISIGSQNRSIFGGISCAFAEWIHRQLHTDQIALRLTNVCMESDCLLHADVLFCPYSTFSREDGLPHYPTRKVRCTRLLHA